jgi:hypothetical protein
LTGFNLIRDHDDNRDGGGGSGGGGGGGVIMIKEDFTIVHNELLNKYFLSVVFSHGPVYRTASKFVSHCMRVK